MARKNRTVAPAIVTPQHAGNTALPTNPAIAKPATLAVVGGNLRGIGRAAGLPIRSDHTSVGDGQIGAAIDAAVLGHTDTGYQSDQYRPFIDTLAAFASVAPPAPTDAKANIPVDVIAAYAKANVWPAHLTTGQAHAYAVQLAGMQANMLKVRAKHGVADARPAWRAPYWATANAYLWAIACMAASLRQHKGK